MTEQSCLDSYVKDLLARVLIHVEMVIWTLMKIEMMEMRLITMAAAVTVGLKPGTFETTQWNPQIVGMYVGMALLILDCPEMMGIRMIQMGVTTTVP